MTDPGAILQTASRYPRLSFREVALLKTVVRRGGMHRPVMITRSERRPAPILWRRNLLEVWYRQSVLTQDLQGPFYALTLSGCRVVSTFDLPNPSTMERVQ